MQENDFHIGFVGVGRMGANIARHVREEAYDVTAVYDVVPERSAQLALEIGCRDGSSPADVAEMSNTVVTVVTDDEAMGRIFAENDDASLLKNAVGRTFINCATVTPNVHVEVQALAERHGGRSLEACMASSITQAREGTLYLMCGGRREVFDDMGPLLEAISLNVRYVGPAGEAAQVKALVNMVMNINTAALAEGLGLGEALGLDLGMLRQVFSQTGAASRVLETDGEDMQSRDHECYFSAAHAAKDSAIALTLAETAGLSLPLSSATLEQYRRLIELHKGELDKSGVAELTFKGRTA